MHLDASSLREVQERFSALVDGVDGSEYNGDTLLNLRLRWHVCD